MKDLFVIYDAKENRIYEGYQMGQRWFLYFENEEVIINAKTKKDLELPTDRILILGALI